MCFFVTAFLQTSHVAFVASLPVFHADAVCQKDWFGNIRIESTSQKYLARLSGIQLSNCPYAEEKTLRDVLCKCPNLYFGSMNNCTYGGTTKSVNMDKELRIRYTRGDPLGTRGAVNDDVMKGCMCCCVELIRSLSVHVLSYPIDSFQHRGRQRVLQGLADQYDDILPVC